MQTPIEIDFQGMSPDPAMRAAIIDRVSALENRYGRITAGRVVVMAPTRRHRTGGIFEIHIRLSLPDGREVNIAKTPQRDERHADPDFAINDAFKRARRGLQDRVRRLQGKVKTHEPEPAATVASLDADGGYGFLAAADGREIYFHRNSVLNGAFDRLQVGTRVVFAEEQGEKGPQASTVRVAGKHGLR